MPMILALAQGLEDANSDHYIKEEQVLSVFDNDDYDKIFIFTLRNASYYDFVGGIFFNKEHYPRAEYDLIGIVSDIVGETGVVYGIEISERSGRDLTNMSKKRPNIIPIIEDGRKPWKYRMMMSMCDVIFADVAQPDQARIIELNARYFLKNGGGFVFSIKANCIDSTAEPEAVFNAQIQELRKAGFKVKEQVTLEPFERDHCVVTGIYKPIKKAE
jgi:hypothetical protein